ncbi:MAG: fasciclin domain-containing protein [Bacteroides sp.]|nr:fasciclin domain-containing protein [Roseburia sp.]MCM1346534.1 fasciclin domain-containing protein [Bacteroides sp.]MCM1421103.1 fasciclin domain-containing protein [Bacteroides sp.]
MNKKLIRTIHAGVAATMVVAACYSCSDTWDEHYDANAGGVSNVSLYQQLSTTDSLSDFCEVLRATGYDEVLNTEQVYTVFAPVNGSFDKSALLAQIESGDKDNVIKHFVQNHITRYNYSITNASNDIMMLNDKKFAIEGSSVNGELVSSKNNLCKNGVLHVMHSELPFRANLYEQLSMDADLSDMYEFLLAYEEDSLDEARSVYRGVDEDGNRIYVDSVMIANNKVMNILDAIINNEDSSYWAIGVTNEAYRKRYEETKKLFNLHSTIVGRDSLQELYANIYTMIDCYFNMNENIHYNDSLMSSTYSKYLPEQNVYYKPFAENGLLANPAEKIECSNGVLYKYDEIPFSIYESFFTKVEVRPELVRNINTDDQYLKTCTYSPITLTGNDGTVYTYLDVAPTTASANPTISFYVNNLLSGTYDISVVMLPSILGTVDNGLTEAGDIKPCQFRANLFIKDANGNFPKSRNYACGGGKNYTNNPDVLLDTVYIDTYTFPETFYGESDAGIMFQLATYVSSSARKNYSREMLIESIIFTPHKDEVTDEE